MSTIYQILKLTGKAPKVKAGTFGIEIETEAISPSSYPSGFVVPHTTDEEGHTVYASDFRDWTLKSDGSLRNFGIEYVLKTPMSLEGSVKALREFEEKTSVIPFLKDQPSTSVHVHTNFMGETPLVMANYIAAWLLFENLLTNFSGETRRSNLFSLPTRFAETQVENYKKMFTGIQMGNSLSLIFGQQYVKYAALNIGTLSKFGSLEARSYRGTTDANEIIVWLMILNRLLEFSKTPGLTPSKFFQSYHHQGPEIVSEVFGEYSSLLKCDGYLQMMERNEVYLYDIVTCIQNWDTFGLVFDQIATPERPRSKRPMTAADLIPNTPWATTNTVFGVTQTVNLNDLDDDL